MHKIVTYSMIAARNGNYSQLSDYSSLPTHILYFLLNEHNVSKCTLLSTTVIDFIKLTNWKAAQIYTIYPLSFKDPLFEINERFRSK